MTRKLAVFVGQTFFRDDDGFSTDESFIRFVDAFSERYGTLTLLGRVEPTPARGRYAIDPDRIAIEPLPYFDQFDPVGLVGALPAVRRRLRQTLPGHGLVWIGGPHLLAGAIRRVCRERSVPHFLMVRQDLVTQFRLRARGIKALFGRGVAGWIERRFRRFAREAPTFAVGAELARAYGAPARAHVHEVYVNLLRSSEIPVAVPPRPARTGPPQLLWIGRLSEEKGLPFLLQAVAPLMASVDAPRLTLVGSGPQRASLESLARRLGIAQRVTFAGYVSFGPDLDPFYRAADLFVLPSLTEGFPQVLFEAMVHGVPCIASAVGGIPGFAGDPPVLRLVPPADAAALRSAIRTLAAAPDDGARLAQHALKRVRAHSLDRERDRMAEILRRELGVAPGAWT